MRKILIILFVLIVCLPMLLAFFFASSFASEKIEAMMQVRAEHRYLVAENLLKQRLAELSLKAGIVAQMRNVRAAIESNDLLELIDLLNNTQKDIGMNTLEGGIEIYRPDIGLMVAEPRTPRLYASDAMVKEALAGNLVDRTFFSDDQLIFATGVPVYGDSGSSPIAALVLYALVNENMVDQIKSIADAEIVIFAEAQGSLKLLVSTMLENGKRSFPVLAILDQQICDVSSGSKKFLLRAGTFNCENGRFFLGVALEKKELFAILSSLKQAFMKTGAGAILFAMLVAVFFSGILTGPLKSLVAAAQRFGSGNFVEIAEVESLVPELKFLSSTFAEMTRQISAKIGEIQSARSALDRKVFDLSVRNLINQAIINKSEDSLLKELLEIVSDTMGTRRSSMLLLDQENGELSLKVAVVKDGQQLNCGHEVSGVVFARGEGFAGHAARYGKAVFSNSPDSDSRFKKTVSSIKNLISVPLFDEGKVIGVINVADRDEDFTEEDAQLLQAVSDQIAIALQKTRLYELAITDGLTGLFIHRYFQMRLESELARATRSNERLALIMFDIDHFKKFNDTWGHQVGDRVIKLVADRIRKNVREGIDIAARYGGEEFTVIMPDTDLCGAMAFAERLRQSVEQCVIEHEDQQLKVTVSLGCAVYPDHCQNRELLICNADSALYKSKERGRNCVTAFKPV